MKLFDDFLRALVTLVATDDDESASADISIRATRDPLLESFVTQCEYEDSRKVENSFRWDGVGWFKLPPFEDMAPGVSASITLPEGRDGIVRFTAGDEVRAFFYQGMAASEAAIAPRPHYLSAVQPLPGQLPHVEGRFVVMDSPGKFLSEFSGFRINLGTSLEILAGLIEALSRLHALGIVHNAIVPENIGVELHESEAEVKLIGFESSFRSPDFLPHPPLPPFLRSPYPPGFQSDVFSAVWLCAYLVEGDGMVQVFLSESDGKRIEMKKKWNFFEPALPSPYNTDLDVVRGLRALTRLAQSRGGVPRYQLIRDQIDDVIGLIDRKSADEQIDS